MDEPKACPYCGARLTSVTYQSRSADEAPEVIELCHNCRLDTQRLLDSAKPCASVTTVRPLERYSRAALCPAKLPHMQPDGKKSIGLELELRLDSRLSELVWNRLGAEGSTVVPLVIEQCQCTLMHGVSGVTGHALTARYRQGEGAIAKQTLYTMRLSPGVTAAASMEHTIEYQPSEWQALAGYCVERLLVIETQLGEGSYTLRVVKHLPSNIVRAEVEAAQVTKDHASHFMEALSLLMEAGYFLSDIAPYLSPGVSYRLTSVSKTAEDSVGASEDTHSFTSKPDGERMWAMLMGSVWFAVKPYHRTKVAAWLMHGSAREYTCPGPVVDCEATADGSIILIDILMDEAGELTNRDKTLTSMLNEAAALAGKGELPAGLVVRDYFPTYEQAYNYSSCCPYPTDGVIAVAKAGMYTRKIKDQRSLELQFGADGLVSSDGQLVGHLLGSAPYPEGTIVELRLAPLAPGLSIPVDEVLVRGDKRVANTGDVCRSILSLSAGGDVADPVLLRRITDLSFEARACIYSAAASMKDVSIVIDVGLGRGQSLGLIGDMLMGVRSARRTMVVLAIDPELKQQVLPTVGLRQRPIYHHSLDEACTSARALVGASVSLLSVRASLRQLLAHSGIMALVRDRKTCFTCAFSCSYIADELRELVSQSLSVVGCCYVYDRVDASGVLVDIPGVKMSLSTANREMATSVWLDRGREPTVYNEPAVTSSSFTPAITVPFLSIHDPVTDGSEAVIKHLYYVVSRSMRSVLTAAVSARVAQ